MKIVQKLWTYLKNHKVDIFLVLLAATYFLYVYITDTNRPGLATDGGWLSYFDQSAYLKQAIATAHLHLKEYFVYGPVYPLAAVPFLLLGLSGGSVFLPFDVFAFAFAIWAVYRFGSSLINQRVGFVAALALLFATPLVTYTTQPWNSSVTLVAVGMVLWVASLTREKTGKYAVFVLALAATLAFGSRYIDVLWVFALGAVLVYLRLGWRKVLLLGGLTFLLCLPILWTHQMAFGSVTKTPYVLHTGMGDQEKVADQSLGAYSIRRIPNAAYGMFVSPFFAGAQDGSKGLLVNAFWFLFAFPLVFFYKRIPKEHRVFVMVLLGVVLLHMLFYLSFRASGPGAIRFGTLHYFKTFWPVLAVCGVASLYYINESLFGNGSASAPDNKPARQKVNAKSNSRPRSKRQKRR